MFITEFSQSPHKFHGCRMNTAFTLYRLYHDRNGIFGTCIFECLQVIVLCIGKSIRHRSESDLTSVIRLSGCRHGTEGSSVEAHGCGYDVVSLRSVFFYPIFSCHLDHRFVSFCTGVLIKDLVHTDGSTDFFCQQSLRNGVRVVKSMHDIFYLILHCCYHFFITVSGGVYSDSCIKIQIRSSVFVIHILIFCCLSQKIESLISLDHIFVYFVFDVLECESCVF